MRPIDADELTEMVWRERLDTRERIANLIARQPTIKRTVERGKWIPYGRDSGYNSFIRCSKCGHEVTLYADSVKVNPNFCENCGADMRGDKNNA